MTLSAMTEEIQNLESFGGEETAHWYEITKQKRQGIQPCHKQKEWGETRYSLFQDQ